jgi:hypothetical protein
VSARLAAYILANALVVLVKSYKLSLARPHNTRLHPLLTLNLLLPLLWHRIFV